MAKKVLVLGGNFGGLTAAHALRRELGDEVDVTVVSTSDRFVFNPSLIWMPFGNRSEQKVTFDLSSSFDRKGVHFVHASATKLDLKSKKVETTSGVFDFDYLVIATGYKNKFDIVPGLGPDGHAYTITSLGDAKQAAVGWSKYLQNPGDIVVAASQGAGCFGAAYEFLFNTAYQLKKAGLSKQVKLTYVTSEPFVGHFGIGGMPLGEPMLKGFAKWRNIEMVPNSAIKEVDDGRMELASGRKLDFSYAMVVPPFIGQDVIHTAPEICDEKGYVKVHDSYQTLEYDNVYAVGIAAAVPMPWQTAVPTGMPKTGFPTEVQAHTAASNIAQQIRGEKPTHEKKFGDIPAVCVLDAGNNGVVMLGHKMLPPRKWAMLVPGPQAHLMKLGFEKYFLWKAKNGHVQLP